MRRWLSRRLYEASFMEPPSCWTPVPAAGCRSVGTSTAARHRPFSCYNGVASAGLCRRPAALERVALGSIHSPEPRVATGLIGKSGMPIRTTAHRRRSWRGNLVIDATGRTGLEVMAVPCAPPSIHSVQKVLVSFFSRSERLVK